MVGVLIDSCGWVSVVDAGLNLDISLGSVVGESELKITDGVKKELDSLNKKKAACYLIYSIEELRLLNQKKGIRMMHF